MTQKNSNAGQDAEKYVERHDQYVYKAQWRPGAECNLKLVLEANRRFMEEVQDQRRADLLTLAWASLEGGRG